MVKSWYFLLLPLATLLFASCLEKTKKTDSHFDDSKTKNSIVKHAKGFSIKKNNDFTVLEIHSPWPNSDATFTYALIPKEKLPTTTLVREAYDAIIATPLERMVVTSTTHIPALEVLGGLQRLVGFPETDYISSMPARELISRGKIKDLGSNERLNTEMVIEMEPDAVIGFAIDHQNSAYETISKARIPIIYNGDWTEQSPLGKAEWIKFFGALLGQEKKADSLFSDIELSYLRVKALASKAEKTPSVISGALYKDVWYLPAGDSWACQFLEDAQADYLWKDSEGTGSLSLSIETVLEKGKDAEFWVSPSGFTTYDEMQQASEHYGQFEAFKNKEVYTFSATKGATEGLLYYELAPQRPDLVLKDLVHIFHPHLLPDHRPFFFKPLQQ